MKRTILMVCWTLASSHLLSGATYYVNSSSGSDSNNGSSGAPWKTLHQSIPKLSAGDTLNCTGTFDEPNGGVSWQYSVSGTASSPITIQGFGAGATSVMEASSSIWYGIHDFTGNYIVLKNFKITSQGNSAGGIVNGGVGFSFDGNNCSVLNCEAFNVTAQVVSAGDTCIIFGNYGNYNTYSNVFIHDTADSDLWRMFGSYNMITHSVISNCNNANYSSGGNHADLMQMWALSTSAVSVSNVFECNLYINNGVPQSGTGPGLGISGGMYQCVQSGNNFASKSPNIHDWVFRNNVFCTANQELEVEMPYIHFYNNVFYNWHGGMGCMYLYNETTAGGSHFYNNVFINSPISDLNGGSSKTMDNNALDSISSSQSQNLSAGTYGPSNFATTTSAAGFVNPAAGDFHLTSGSVLIGKGKNLYNDPSMSTVDKDGVARPVSGAWDIGPYQYGTPGPNTNPVIQISPATLDFGTVLTNTGTNLTLTVQNVGAGTLVGTATVSAPFQIVSGGTYSLGSNKTQTVTVRFAPTAAGQANQTVGFSGGSGASAAVTGLAYANQAGSSFNSTAGTIVGPFVVSSGYISQPSLATSVSSGGEAIYGFTVPTAGSYTVSAQVLAPNAGAKSFWVNVDSQPVDPTMIWDIYPYSTNFVNQTVSWRGNSTTITNDQFAPKIFDLTAGNHCLIVRGREDSVELGAITIAPYGTTPPPAPTNLHVVAGQ